MQCVAVGSRATARAAYVRACSAGLHVPGRRRRPTPPRPRAVLVRLLVFAGLCVTGTALLALLGAGSASAAPTLVPHAHSHADRAPGGPAAQHAGPGHQGAGLLDGVGRLATSALSSAGDPVKERHSRPAGHGAPRADGDGVVPSLVGSVLTGKDPNAESPKPPASHRPRSGRHGGADDAAVTGVTPADRAVASIAGAVHPVTRLVARVAAPVRPVTGALTAPLAPVVGEAVAPLHPVTDPAGHLLTSTGLVPLPAGAARPPVSGAGSHQHENEHHAAASATAPVPAGHGTPGAVHTARVLAGGITGATASGAAASARSDLPADQPAPFWPVGVTLPAAGGSGSSNTMNSGAGGNATAGHAERVGAAPWPRVIGIAHSSDELARQLDAAKPQVSPD